jgi:hypothetical protein
MIEWIILHGLDAQQIYLNPEQIISIRQPRGLNSGHWPAGVRCLVTTVDGKYLTVVETCAEIRERLK